MAGQEKQIADLAKDLVHGRGLDPDLLPADLRMCAFKCAAFIVEQEQARQLMIATAHKILNQR